MASVKGCTNSKCNATEKKITYKETESFCSKCGGTLTYVCKKCYTPVGKNEKLCVRCQAEKEDRQDKAKKVARDAGGAIITAGAFVVTNGKNLLKYLPKK